MPRSSWLFAIHQRCPRTYQVRSFFFLHFIRFCSYALNATRPFILRDNDRTSQASLPRPGKRSRRRSGRWKGPGWRGRQSSGEYLGSARPLPREFSATINSFTFWREAGARGGHHGSLWACLGREVLDRRNVLDLIYGRSHMAIDPRIPTMLGRCVSGFHRPGRHRLLVPSAKRREMSGESHEG